MSAYLESTSAVLGEYMLKGWTMTDLVCHHCRTTPLMREPTSQALAAGRSDAQRIQFCGRCDGSPDGSSSSASAAAATPALVAPVAAQITLANPEAAVGGPSSADRAANDISSLLLQGYSLLGTNCPAPTCQGIPLVGYPKGKDGKRDPRKRCVGCGQGYVDEKDAGSIAPATVAVEEAMSPRSKRRRELYAEGEKTNQAVAAAAKSAAAAASVATSTSRSVAPQAEDDFEMADLDEPINSARASNPLQAAQASLERTLASLSESLDRQAETLGSRSNSGPFFIELKLHTEAIQDICKTLQAVKQAQK